jgi:uncharacterized protein (TIGR00251 family)
MYIKVRVIANARKELVEETEPLRYKVHLKEPAERGLANSRLIELFQAKFPNTRVRIVNGHHSPSKLLAIDTEE